MIRRRSISLLTAVLGMAGLLGTAGFAPAQDPPAPPRGFPITEVLNRLVTYTDGYKTLADLRYPAVKPGPRGWPLIVKVHGLGGSRRNGAADLKALASRGYAVVAYDVRGQGDAKKLNPSNRGTTLIGLDEKIDLAEIIETVVAKFPGVVDGGRVGVMGGSQGGAHSWAAAAWSERSFPRNPRRTTPFPKILAVAPAAFTGESLPDLMPDHNAVHARVVDKFFNNHPAVILDPAFKKIGQLGFLKQDFAGLYAFFSNDPGRSNMPGLARTRVATLANLSYHDYWMRPNSSIDILKGYPSGTPWRLVLGSGGHGSPKNRNLGALWSAERLRWFDRFLKNVLNGIEREPRTVAADVPSDPRVYLDPGSRWKLRYDGPWPAADVSLQRWYLRAGGRLSRTAPAGSETPDRVRHRVPSGFGPAEFAPIALDLPALLKKIPLASVAYTSARLAGDQEVAGRPRARVVVDPTGRNFILHAALLRHDPATNQEVYLTQGYRAYRLTGSPARQVVDIELGAINTILPAGSALRLRLENLTIHRSPGQAVVRIAPYFESVDLDIQHSRNAVSHLDLPVRAAVRPSLVADRVNQPVSRPERMVLTVGGGQARAGRPYLVAASLSGIAPGFPLPGGRVPLNPDPLTVVSLVLAGSALFPDTIGTLDAAGTATAGVDFRVAAPLPLALVGIRLCLAGWIHRSEANLTGEATNPVEVFFVP